MHDTVDQAYGAEPRTLANVIEDARRAAGRFGMSGSQGWPGKDPGSIEGNDGAALSPSGGCRVLGRGLQEATVAGMLGVRPGQVSGYPGHSGEFGRRCSRSRIDGTSTAISSGYGSLNVEFLMGNAQAGVMVLPKPYDLEMLEKTLHEAAEFARL